MSESEVRRPSQIVIAKHRSEPLFKFRTFRPELDLDPDYQGYAASMLRDGIVYCASTLELNDPWEGRPHFVVPAPENAEAQERFIDALMETVPDRPRAEAEEWLKRMGYAAVAREFQDAHYRSNSGLGVCSMAGNPVHPLMWSYYASGHQGFCWMIDNTISPFASAAQVTYADEYPEIEWSRWKEQDVTALSILRKARFWQHENEYRLLVPREPPAEIYRVIPHNGKGAVPRGRFLAIPREAVTGIVFGLACSPASRGKLLNLARSFGHDLECYVAGVHRRRFEIFLRPIERAEQDALVKLSS